ncbi:MAG: hypothetical protein ACPHK8_04780 [Thermoplasmatota archaeon]
MGHASNATGALVIVLAAILLAGGAGALTYGVMDRDAASEHFVRDQDREEFDEQAITGGTVAIVGGTGLAIVGLVLVGQAARHKEKINTGFVVTRRTFGAIFLILGIILFLGGMSGLLVGQEMEAENRDGFTYDDDQGQENIALAAAGAAALGFSVPLVLASVIMLIKRDELDATTAGSIVTSGTGDATEPSAAASAAKTAAKTRPAPAYVETSPNRMALYVFAGFFGLAVIVGIAFLAMGGGNGGAFFDDPVSETTVYHHNMTNTGNLPPLGTIGSAWEETFVAHERVTEIAITFEKSTTVSMRYTLEMQVDGVWEELATRTGTALQNSLTASGAFGGETLRFRVEPDSSYVQSSELKATVFESS